MEPEGLFLIAHKHNVEHDLRAMGKARRSGWERFSTAVYPDAMALAGWQDRAICSFTNRQFVPRGLSRSKLTGELRWGVVQALQRQLQTPQLPRSKEARLKARKFAEVKNPHNVKSLRASTKIVNGSNAMCATSLCRSRRHLHSLHRPPVNS